MKTRKAQFGFLMQWMRKLIMAVIIVILIVTISFSRYSFDEEQIFHMHAAKSGSLSIDALSTVEGNVIFGDFFVRGVSFSKEGNQIATRRVQGSEIDTIRRVALISEDQELRIDGQTSDQWFFAKMGDIISVTKTVPADLLESCGDISDVDVHVVGSGARASAVAQRIASQSDVEVLPSATSVVGLKETDVVIRIRPESDLRTNQVHIHYDPRAVAFRCSLHKVFADADVTVTQYKDAENSAQVITLYVSESIFDDDQFTQKLVRGITTDV